LKGLNTTTRNSTGHAVSEGDDGVVFVICTIDVDQPVALSNQAFRRPEYVPETDAEPDLLHYLDGAVRYTTPRAEKEAQDLPCWHIWS
jgi:hypothetical protein